MTSTATLKLIAIEAQQKSARLYDLAQTSVDVFAAAHRQQQAANYAAFARRYMDRIAAEAHECPDETPQPSSPFATPLHEELHWAEHHANSFTIAEHNRLHFVREAARIKGLLAQPTATCEGER